MTTLLTATLGAHAAPASASAESALKGLVSAEDRAALLGTADALKAVFGGGGASAAYRQAWLRGQYFRAWAKARGFEFTGVETTVRPLAVHPAGGGNVWTIKAAVGERFFYRYGASQPAPDAFGLGVYHVFRLSRVGPSWRIVADQNFPSPAVEMLAKGRMPPDRSSRLTGPAALRAVAYADRYCGAAPGCGNDGRYNPAYTSYNDAGGDCTAFISQVLRAAGFAETPRWSYDHRTGEGSEAWSNANGLTEFLLSSGRASLIGHGSFAHVTEVGAGESEAPIARLRLGDLITNFRRGRMQHSGIVVGFDSHGYPLVDAHSSDRYHVPWDLNWDRDTVFYLWRVHYGRLDGGTKSEVPSRPH